MTVAINTLESWIDASVCMRIRRLELELEFTYKINILDRLYSRIIDSTLCIQKNNLALPCDY